MPIATRSHIFDVCTPNTIVFYQLYVRRHIRSACWRLILLALYLACLRLNFAFFCPFLVVDRVFWSAPRRAITEPVCLKLLHGRMGITENSHPISRRVSWRSVSVDNPDSPKNICRQLFSHLTNQNGSYQPQSTTCRDNLTIVTSSLYFDAFQLSSWVEYSRLEIVGKSFWIKQRSRLMF